LNKLKEKVEKVKSASRFLNTISGFRAAKIEEKKIENPIKEKEQ
jgi:hypothetical protein